MEVRRIEGWRSREARQIEQLRDQVVHQSRYTEVREDGHRVRYDNGLDVWVGRRFKRVFSRGAEWQRWRDLVKVQRLRYITDWQQRMRIEQPEKWREQRRQIDARRREKYRDQINQKQREMRQQRTPEEQEAVRLQAAIYAQFVQLAGLRKGSPASRVCGDVATATE